MTHSRQFQDLTGRRYGRWTVLSLAIRAREGGGVSRWLLRCECGTEKILPAHVFKNGDSGSCGCLKRELDGRPRPWRIKFHGSRQDRSKHYRKILKESGRQNEYARAYHKAHPEVQENIRARRRAAPGKITASQWSERVAEFGGCCAYCLKPCERPSIEHVRPLSKGGSNDIENVVPACMPCNSAKGAGLIFEWASRMVSR